MKVVKAFILLGLFSQSLVAQAKGPDLFVVKPLPPQEVHFVCKDQVDQKEYIAAIEIDADGYQYNSSFQLETTGVLILKGARDYIHYFEDLVISKYEGYLRAGYMINIDGINPKGDKFSYDLHTYEYFPNQSLTKSKTLFIHDYPNLKCQ